MSQIHKITENFGLRADKYLCHKFDISFALAQKLIRQKKVKINKAKIDADYKTLENDIVEIFVELPNRNIAKKMMVSEYSDKFKKFISHIIFEDDNLVAINKPSGLAVQGGSGVKISVDDYIRSKNWQLVHRLDKDTSGVLLIAKNNETADLLTEIFKNKQIQKTYLAYVIGVPKKKSGTVNIPLKKKFVKKNEKVYPDMADGKEAITHYKVLEDFADYALVELNPITGRTHQLRVHMKEIGHAIMNDPKYGGKGVLRPKISDRLCLHAHKIVIDDYFGKKLEIKCDAEFYQTGDREI
jgi:23S rRNA pseudouridine955/2504/2580 synthase